MSQETESAAKIAYNSLLRKLFEISNMQDECKYLVDHMVDLRETIHLKFAAIRNMPYEIKEEMDVMMENKDLLQFDEEFSDNTYESTKKAYDLKVQEQTTYLETQKALEAVKLEELHNFVKETNTLEGEIIQKALIILDFQRKTDVETDLIEELRACFEDLTSTAEMKAKNSVFVEIQNKLQVQSSQLNEEIDTKKDRNLNIHKEITAISEELAAVEAQCRYKALDVDKLLCKNNFNETRYKHSESKNHKLNGKIEATQQNQENEIAELEMHISNQEEVNESLKKRFNELTDQINSDLGNSASLEEKQVQSENEMAKLNAECDALNNVLNEQNNLKTESEEKLKKFQAIEAKLLEAERQMKDELEKQSQMSQNQYIKPPERPKCGVLVEGLRADEREHVFLQPVITPRTMKTPRRSKKKRQSPRAIDGPIVQSADSSVSEIWGTSVDERDQRQMNEKEEQRHYHSLELMKQFVG